MKKHLLATACGLLLATTAMAETATFNFVSDNPYNWNSLPQDASGYIDNVAMPINCVEGSVQLSINGKCRRQTQKRLGGLNCLCVYSGTTLTITAQDGIAIDDVSVYSSSVENKEGQTKIDVLKVASGSQPFGDYEETGEVYVYTVDGTSTVNQIFKTTTGCVYGAPVVIVDEGGTGVITSVVVNYHSEDLLPADLSYSSYECVAYLGQDNEFPVLSNPNNLPIDYSSENEDVATIDEQGRVTLVGPGKTTIYAGTDIHEPYNWGEATYQLTVKRNAQAEVTYNFSPVVFTNDAQNAGYSKNYPLIPFSNKDAELWWTTNPALAGSYAKGTEFRPLTITQDDTQITFTHEGDGNGNVRVTGSTGSTTGARLQIGKLTNMELKANGEGSYLYGVIFNMYNALTDASLPTCADGQLLLTEAGKTLEWIPNEGTEVCFLKWAGTAYFSSIDVAYRKSQAASVNNVSLEDTNAPVEYYNLQGIRVAEPANGIYIRRQGNRVSKEIKL